MSCTIPTCDRKREAYGLCGMHYRRTKRAGDPLVKLRARGVMDAPVLRREKRKSLGLGPTQVKVLRELADGEVVPYGRLREVIGGQSQNALQQVVTSLRRRFGWDVIETHQGKGYSGGPILRRLLE